MHDNNSMRSNFTVGWITLIIVSKTPKYSVKIWDLDTRKITERFADFACHNLTCSWWHATRLTTMDTFAHAFTTARHTSGSSVIKIQLCTTNNLKTNVQVICIINLIDAESLWFAPFDATCPHKSEAANINFLNFISQNAPPEKIMKLNMRHATCNLLL